MILRRVKIRRTERGLLFKDREFVGVLGAGTYWFLDVLGKVRVDVLSTRDAWLQHRELDVIAKSGELLGEARVLDLQDRERALVWIDGRFDRALGPGQYALWTSFRKVEVEVVDAGTLRFDHEQLATILRFASAQRMLEVFEVETGRIGLLYLDGEHVATLDPGTHAYWKGIGRLRLETVDLREAVLDVAGQEIMTADKVTLRLNAVVTYRVTDAPRSVAEVEDCKQALYRDAQLALRGVIGTRDLDGLLSEKDAVAADLGELVKRRAADYGVEVVSLGIRDVILPGEMKDLMNKVTEAKKASEASLITRREETAAMRSQSNTAKILAQNPTLMRLRELEVLEKVAEKANLSVVLGEKGLADRVVKLL